MPSKLKPNQPVQPVLYSPQQLGQLSYLHQLWLTSKTKVWSYIQMVAGGSLLSLHMVVTDPTIREAITPLNLPAYVWAGLTVLGVITYAAHGHNTDV